MGLLSKLFSPKTQDAGTTWGHIAGIAALAAATPEGQAMIMNGLTHRWGWLIPVVVAYFGGARAGQAGAAKPE